jgi:hypothetical protein
MTVRPPLLAATLLVALAALPVAASACSTVAPLLDALARATRPWHGGVPPELLEKIVRDGAPPFLAGPTSGPAPVAGRAGFDGRVSLD